MRGIRLTICSVVLATSPMGVGANAQVMLDTSKITCEQLLSAAPTAIDAAIWLSGYYNGLHKNTMLDLNQFKRNAEVVVHECQGSPKKAVMETVDGLMAKKP